jgi:hypothetical protein
LVEGAKPRTADAITRVDRDTRQAARDELLVREKAHTREGDAIAAARRRLPMTGSRGRARVLNPPGVIESCRATPGDLEDATPVPSQEAVGPSREALADLAVQTRGHQRTVVRSRAKSPVGCHWQGRS